MKSYGQPVLNLLTGIILRNPLPWPDREYAGLEEKIWQTGLLHGVLALCSYQLHDPALAHAVPDALRQRLKSGERRAAITELLRRQEIKTVLDRLAAHNIQPLLLKGCPLAYSLYPEPWLRPRCDTDFFFSNQDAAEQAWQVVQKMGYTRHRTVSGKLVSHEFSCYTTGPAGISHCLDFHWKLSNSHTFARIFSFTELMEASTPVPELNNARTPGKVHALLYACMHRLGHAADNASDRLIWLYDIHLLADKLSQDDWQRLVLTARKKQLADIILNGLETTVRAFSTQIPQQALLGLQESNNKKQFNPARWKHRGRRELDNFAALDNWHDRLLLCREHLFPARSYMFAKYGINSRLLLPLLYLVRIIQGIPKLLK